MITYTLIIKLQRTDSSENETERSSYSQSQTLCFHIKIIKLLVNGINVDCGMCGFVLDVHTVNGFKH